MLYSNEEFSKEYKKKIYEKIKSDFEIALPEADEQKLDDLNSPKRIAEAIGIVRKKVGSGDLLLQHNYECGFARNLVGTSLVYAFLWLLSSVLNIFFGSITIGVPEIILVIHLIPLVFKSFLIDRHASLYAHTLFREYLPKY